ncbi:unnamed protein product, partial [Prunus brigantina]
YVADEEHGSKEDPRRFPSALSPMWLMKHMAQKRIQGSSKWKLQSAWCVF